MKTKSYLLALSVIVPALIGSCGNVDEFESPFVYIDTLFTQPISAYDLCIDKNDNKWIATSSGLTKYSNGQKTIFKKADGLANDTVYHVTADSKNHIWCLTKDRESICEYDGTKFIVHRPSTIGIRKMNYPTAIMVDPRNHIWVGAYLGLYEFDGTTWKHHYYQSAASNAWVRRLYPDTETEGSIIIQGDRDITRFNGITYQKLDKLYDLDPQSIECIAQKNGTVYCGVVLQGLLTRTRNTNSFISMGDDPGYNFIHDISIAPNGRIWLATGKGLFYIEKNKVYDFKYDGFGTTEYRKIVLDYNGKPWFASGFGLITLK